MPMTMKTTSTTSACYTLSYSRTRIEYRWCLLQYCYYYYFFPTFSRLFWPSIQCAMWPSVCVSVCACVFIQSSFLCFQMERMAIRHRKKRYPFSIVAVEEKFWSVCSRRKEINYAMRDASARVADRERERGGDRARVRARGRVDKRKIKHYNAAGIALIIWIEPYTERYSSNSNALTPKHIHIRISEFFFWILLPSNYKHFSFFLYFFFGRKLWLRSKLFWEGLCSNDG